MSQWKLSADTGGTFTDCFCESPEGKISRLKVLSNSTLRGKIIEFLGPSRFSAEWTWNFDASLVTGYQICLYPGGFTSTIQSVQGNEIILDTPLPDNNYAHFEVQSDEEVPVFAARILTGTSLHDPLPPLDLRLGTTRGTNALLERAGANVIFLITKGFGDLLTIGNQQRPDLFTLNVRKPSPFYSQVIEVEERMTAKGDQYTALTDNECHRIIEQLGQFDPDNTSLAVSLLHSYKNPAHELLLKEKLLEAGFSWISCSSELSANSKILHRAETTVVNAYLSPIMNRYFSGIGENIRGTLKVMTSAGHLRGISGFHPKDGLLSGPAGGIKGAAMLGRQCGKEHMVTFDMGGTSTDVSIYDGQEDFAYETAVGGAVIQAPCLAIDTIAAGGGSICTFDGQMLDVGPSSAGAQPGPACYGSGGPLTVTDINLLAGRLHESNFSIPLHPSASEDRLTELMQEMHDSGHTTERHSLLRSLLQLTTEKMAKSIRQLAIRKGVDTSRLTLSTFGGAGGQHACDLAEQLMIKEVMIPYDAGLLSAYGIRTTEIANFEEQELRESWADFRDAFVSVRDRLFETGCEKLTAEGYDRTSMELKSCFLYLRFAGQESSIEIDYTDTTDVEEEFERAYRHLFGHWLENKELEITSIKVVAALRQKEADRVEIPPATYSPTPDDTQEMLDEDGMEEASIYTWENLKPGATIDGPALVGSENCTLFLKKGWVLVLDNALNGHMTNNKETHGALMDEEAANLSLFTNRFSSIVEEMGAILQRTSFSVNVKERVDFSCAMLDAEGRLVVNAPHIPVHLGSMGLCVRSVMKYIPMQEGDVIITNHPKYGGSHLPDITLISPVFHEGQCIAYVANRAHHAEIGGKTPGSMPPDATTLAEEGVLFSPDYLIRGGEANWKQIRKHLTSGPYPSRSPEENIADLQGALASIQSGIRQVKKLCALYGADVVSRFMKQLYEYSGDRVEEAIALLPETPQTACERLDDGHILQVAFSKSGKQLVVDFSGSASRHPGNLNATPAIVRSVVLYVVRLLLKENLPLNEGMLRNVDIILPPGMLNPDFSTTPMPSVVGGNTEVSQRLTDTLLKALGMSACSYGTMNNIIFGNKQFGFYETICGGTGAGPGFHGCDAVHQHMTNTRITDPEIIELRYPVHLESFTIRKGSGGQGKWSGGDGVIRAIRFLAPVELSVLTQHRTIAPYGLHCGKPGKPGKQWIERNGQIHQLSATDYSSIEAGDLFVIATPGGGGWGDQAE